MNSNYFTCTITDHHYFLQIITGYLPNLSKIAQLLQQEPIALPEQSLVMSLWVAESYMENS